MNAEPVPASDFTLSPKTPSIAYQIWTRIRKEPQLATDLTVEKLMGLREFREINKNAVSAAISTLAKATFIVSVGTAGRSIVYGPGPRFSDPTLKFGYRVLGGKRNRKPGYKGKLDGRPEFALGQQAGLPLGANSARDEARFKNLQIARALPIDVIEQVLAEKRAEKKS